MLILSVALLAGSLSVAAQAPDGSYHRGTVPQPAFSKDARRSLIAGHLATAQPIGSFPCPENAICLDSVWDDTFVDMKTQLGPAIDPRSHVRSIHDAGIAGHPVMVYAVRADNN